MAGDHPVSRAQKGLWILDRFHPGSPAYAVPLLHRIEGEPDVAALEWSLSEVVRRHEVLRTVFRLRAGAPRQTVRPAEPVRIPVVDVSAHPDPAAEAERLASAEARRPFDLAADPMIRALLVRQGPRRHLLCLTLHHIACDGWSVQILQRELSAGYRAFGTGTEPLPEPPSEQYAAFAAHQAERLADLSGHPALDHWRGRLADVPAPATVPGDRPRPPVWDFSGAHVRFEVDPTAAERAGLLARACRATPYAVFLAAFAVVAAARGGRPEAVIGSPVTHRRTEGHHRMIGMFVNTVVQRVAVPPEATFRDLVVGARDESRSAIAHGELPFETVVDELNPARDPGFNPLYQLMLTYQEGGPAGLDLPGCSVTTEYGDTATAKHDLSLSLTRAEGRCTGRLEYSTELFEEATARRIAEEFRAVLTAGVGDPRRTVGELRRPPAVPARPLG
ncbi:hypothetical protein EAO71_35295 [Streptomyces sp. ms191]|uniref:condensation domain-containing protein n=1 Tax=Streptomyces sp. ms191 TaxID=1827978 RepID=UPI0011CDFC6A|nr:condensation domain-containing protein [Streptomyces sp. ms191]TXS16037.1 hypothetical protein EAO71_35295 [Streptomyces sp. ms191]